MRAPIRLLACGALTLVCGCTGPDPAPLPGGDQSGSFATTTVPTPPVSEPPVSTPPVSTPPVSTPPGSEPPDFDAAAAFEFVELLADDIGPREATSTGFREAADLVAARFRELGFDVERQRLAVPGGTSWGVPVPAGETHNVVATLPGFEDDRPHRLIGAHLDTVPQAPGAEDNGSGIGVLLELARIAAEHPPEVPVVLVAFGAEEPRGSGDARHHYGSRHMVAEMPDRQREGMLGMVSLDRVGVPGGRVPVCHGGLGAGEVREELVAAARGEDIPTRRCENRTSDHWSFEKAGVPAARLGGVPYPAYHSRADQPRVVETAQLDKVGRIAAAWMLSPR